jgi:hypothetical protein
MIVLGPQASPPARVEKNQEQSDSSLNKIALVILHAGSRGRLRSQDDRSSFLLLLIAI